MSRVRERTTRTLIGRILHFAPEPFGKSVAEPGTEPADSAAEEATTHQRVSELVQARIAERPDDPDSCCADLTQSVAALRGTSSPEDLKDRLPLMGAIWAGAEGLAWIKPKDGNRPGGFDFVVGAGSADSFLAWMLFFACFGGIDVDMYGPGLRMFRREIVEEVEDPYDIVAVHSYLEEIAERYGMLSDGHRL
jgi:hypothetical protein